MAKMQFYRVICNFDAHEGRVRVNGRFVLGDLKVVSISFGPSGEFFMETSADAFSSEDVSVAEELYKRIMNARSECDIIHEARRAAEGDAE